ncbi:MAG: aldo/keto reductase [Candidatus Mycalebacterium zealandia]|nr:MAG: aldo/keto reductase [Candidatus Mycalebacterium zealandia]
MKIGLKTLGGTGAQIPEIGLGTWNYTADTAPLEAGIKLGSRFIDTAEGYGTERVSGEAARRACGDVFMATKVSGRNLGYDNVLKSADASLEKLGVDVIDLYQIHWANPVFSIKDTMRAMSKLLDNGLARYIGVSNFSVAEFEEAQSYMPNARIVSNQVRYSLNDRQIEDDLLPFCERNGVTLIAYTPLDSGRLCRESSGGGYGLLSKIARETDKTEAQVALNWCLCRDCVVVIPKSDSIERTVENCGCSGWRLDDAQFRALCEAF